MADEKTKAKDIEVELTEEQLEKVAGSGDEFEEKVNDFITSGDGGKKRPRKIEQ